MCKAFWAPKVGSQSFNWRCFVIYTYFKYFCIWLSIGILRRLRTNRDWELPEWKELNAGLLFSNGLQLLLIILGYFGIPTLLGWAISILAKKSIFWIYWYSKLSAFYCLCTCRSFFGFSCNSCLSKRWFICGCLESFIDPENCSFIHPKINHSCNLFLGNNHPCITFVRNCIFSWHVDLTCLFECIKFFKRKLILNEAVCLLTTTNVMHVDMIGSCINL